MSTEFSENEELVIPEELPLLPIRDVVVYPYMILPLFVGREPSIRAVNEALAKDRLIFLAAQKQITDENPSADTIYSIGTVAMIMRMRKLPDGRVKILVQGLMKGTVLQYTQEKPFFIARIKQIKEKPATRDQVEIEATMRTVKEQLEKVISLGRMLSPDILMVVDDINDAGRLADLVAVDLDDPSLHPRSDLTKSVVYAMSPRAVTDVWVHGRLVVESGRLVTVDQDELLARVRALTHGWSI